MFQSVPCLVLVPAKQGVGTLYTTMAGTQHVSDNLGPKQFHNLSKDSQSLAMFKILEENKQMLKALTLSETKRNQSIYDEH